MSKLESGLVYGRGERNDEVNYAVMDDTPVFHELLTEAITSAKFDYRTSYLLVRMGETGWYPLPLLFATAAERETQAAEIGLNPPTQKWVNRKLNALKRKFN